MIFIGIILLTFSAIFNLAWNYLNKTSVTDTRSWLLVIFLGFLITSPCIIIYREYIPYLYSFIPLILFTSFCAMSKLFFTLIAYRKGDYTYVYPMANSLPIVFSLFLVMVIGKNTNINFITYIGYILIIIGCFFIPITDFKSIKISKYFDKVFIAVVLSALTISFFHYYNKEIINELSKINNDFIGVSALIVSINYLGQTICLIPYIFIEKYTCKIEYNFNKKLLKNIILLVIFNALSNLFIFLSYKFISNTSNLMALRQISIPLSFLVGYFLLKEKIYLGKKIGVIVICIGLILIL